MEENILIDTLVFSTPLEMEYDKVIGMFSSEHDQDCCEHHELDFYSTKKDFETAQEFLSKVDKIDITGVEGMGINLRMYDGANEYCIFVPGRGSNNGYYGDKIDLVVSMPDRSTRTYNCTKYQDY